MDKITKQIQQLNSVFHSMKKNYDILNKMFSNHSTIKQKFILSEEILMQGYMLIGEKLEEVETRKEFAKIIKGIKEK